MPSKIARLAALGLFASAATIALSTQSAYSQCQGGGQRQQQGGMQRQQQSTMQPQQQQTSSQNGFLRQSQQMDAFQGQIALQYALRQQEMEWMIAYQRHRQYQQLRGTAPESRGSEYAVYTPSTPTLADREETASGLLRVASGLADEAKSVRKLGEGALAARLRDRAEDRLQKILSRYGGTRAADEAKTLLDKLDR